MRTGPVSWTSASSGGCRFSFGGRDLLDPVGKRLHELGEEFARLFFLHLALIVEPVADAGEIHLRLLQDRHVQEGQRLAQVMVRAEAADIARRIRNNRRRLAVEQHVHRTHVGGGLGIQYATEAPPQADELVTRLLQRIDARGHGQRELLLEPGRSLVGNAGVLLTEVLYLKPGANQDDKHFCIVDAAMNDLIRPALYQAWVAIEPCVERVGARTRWDVVGPVCESGDWLGRGRELALQQGDVLAVLSAGAYGMSMASNYNSRARAAEVLIVDGQPVLIRERERIQDLYAQDRLLP